MNDAASIVSHGQLSDVSEYARKALDAYCGAMHDVHEGDYDSEGIVALRESMVEDLTYLLPYSLAFEQVRRYFTCIVRFANDPILQA